MVKNLPANAGYIRDVGLIPGLGRSPGEGNVNPLSILAWKIPWTEEAGRLHSPRVRKELDTTEHTCCLATKQQSQDSSLRLFL